jgi:hypothetical protein
MPGLQIGPGANPCSYSVGTKGSFLEVKCSGREVNQSPPSSEQIIHEIPKIVGRDSSVGIATRYGLNGPGIEPRCG